MAMDCSLFQRMQEAARRFGSGESDREEIMTPNGLAVLQRDPSDPRGFRIDFVGEGARRSVALQVYPALPSRPPGYPAPLPFLAHCRSTVDTLDRTVTWHEPPAPEAAFDNLAAQILADGWAPADGTPAASTGAASSPGARRRSFRKEGGVRTLALELEDGLARIVLREHRVGEAQEPLLNE
jgi:hypothetical protein